MMSGDFAVCGQWQSFLRLSVILKKQVYGYIYIYGDDEGEDGEWW